MDTFIVTISDTHTHHNEIKVPDGDIIIHAGDWSYRGTKGEIDSFVNWYASLPHPWKVLIAGNHDKGTDRDQQGIVYQGLPEYFEKRCNQEGILLLNDNSCAIFPTNSGETIKIWGSPVQPTFGIGWAWNRNRGAQIKEHWDKISDGVDIVVTHGPAYGYGDRVYYGGDRVGCEDLSEALLRVKPKLHVFGHIHEDRGVFRDDKNNITYVNASSLNLQYRPYLGKSFRFSWEKLKKGESRGEDYE